MTKWHWLLRDQHSATVEIIRCHNHEEVLDQMGEIPRLRVASMYRASTTANAQWHLL